VWDVPSPLVIGFPSKIKVGVKCTEGCSLEGKQIEIRDEGGAKRAGGVLGPAPWPGTAALYWTEIELPGLPADLVKDGPRVWSVAFVPKDSPVPHETTCLDFAVLPAKPPEHDVIVKVIDRSTRIAIGNAAVRLGVYRTCSDRAGLARVAVPAGAYDLSVYKTGHESLFTTMQVAADLTVEVEVCSLPQVAEPYWM
jgi:hypothetical protein